MKCYQNVQFAKNCYNDYRCVETDTHHPYISSLSRIIDDTLAVAVNMQKEAQCALNNP